MAVTRICVEKMLPMQESQMSVITSSPPKEQERLAAAFFAQKIWKSWTTVPICFLSDGETVPRPSVSELSRETALPLDPLQKKVASLSVREAVKKVVRERIQPFVNLKLPFVEDPALATIRISFVPEEGAWSLIGTDALQESPGRPTMNLGWFDVATTIHEFGHMLGMIHEHQNPRGTGIDWNVQKVYEWAAQTQGWTPIETDRNVLDRYDVSAVNGSRYDAASIMLYFFPASLTMNGKGTRENSRLSQLDIQWIAQTYPAAQNPHGVYEKMYSHSVRKMTSSKETPSSKNEWVVILVFVGAIVLVVAVGYFLKWKIETKGKRKRA